MVVFGRFGFTDHDRVGKTIGNIGEVDFGAKAIETAAHFVGLVRIAVVGTPAITPEDSVGGVLKADPGGGISPSIQRFARGIAVNVVRARRTKFSTPAGPDGALRPNAAYIVANRGI